MSLSVFPVENEICTSSYNTRYNLNIFACEEQALQHIPIHGPRFSQVLNLQNNELKNLQLPYVPDYFSALQVIDLYNNKIEVIDVSFIQGLSNTELYWLDMSYNEITSLNSSIFNIQTLRRIDLWDNHILCSCEYSFLPVWEENMAHSEIPDNALTIDKMRLRKYERFSSGIELEDYALDFPCIYETNMITKLKITTISQFYYNCTYIKSEFIYMVMFITIIIIIILLSSILRLLYWKTAKAHLPAVNEQYMSLDWYKDGRGKYTHDQYGKISPKPSKATVGVDTIAMLKSQRCIYQYLIFAVFFVPLAQKYYNNFRKIKIHVLPNPYWAEVTLYGICIDGSIFYSLVKSYLPTHPKS